MTGCKIGKIKMKNGGAEIKVIDSANDSTRGVKFSFGEIHFRMYDGEPINRQEMLYLLRSAEDAILRGDLV